MRRRALGLTFVLVIVGGLAGIVAGEGRAVAAGSGSARVTLLSKGASPRSPLRLAITAGAATSASMEFSQSIEQSVDGTPTNAVDLPPTQLLVHVTAGSVSPDGDAQISSSYSDIKVVDDGSLEPAELERLESAYAPLASVTGTGRLTARNQVFDSTLAGTEGFDPAVATAMSQVSDQVAVDLGAVPGGGGGNRRAVARRVIGPHRRYRRASDLRVHLARTRHEPCRVGRRVHADRAATGRRARGCAERHEGQDHEVQNLRHRQHDGRARRSSCRSRAGCTPRGFRSSASRHKASGARWPRR